MGAAVGGTVVPPGGADEPGATELGAVRGGEMDALLPLLAAPGTCSICTITAGAGRADCAGGDSTGMFGAGEAVVSGCAGPKVEALAAAMTPVRPAAPATPAAVQYAMRRTARSRSLGR